MAKITVTNYAWNTAAKTLTLPDFPAVEAERLYGLFDVTAGVLVYAPSVGTVSASGSVLTIGAVPAGVADGHEFTVIYDDPTVSASTGLTDAQLRALAVEVSDGGGSITVDGPLTDAELRAADVNVHVTNPTVAVTGPLTDVELRASAVTVDGTVAVSNHPAVYPVEGGNATDVAVAVSNFPVSTALTDAQLRATDVGVTVANFPASQPVTGPLTDVELRASAVAVSAAALPLPTGASTEAKQPALGVAGTQSADVITVQGDPAGTPIPVTFDPNNVQVSNLANVDGQPVDVGNGAVGAGTQRVALADATILPGNTAPTATDSSLVVTISPNSPSGGGLNADVNLISISGQTVDIGTGPSASGTQRVALTDDSKVLLWDGVDMASVVGPSAPAVATDSALVVSLSPNSNVVKITDGTTSASVKGASTPAAATDTALVVAKSPNDFGGNGTQIGNTVGTSAVSAANAKAGRKYLTVQARPSNTGTVYVNVVGVTATASNGIALAAGDALSFEGNWVPDQAISVIGSAAGQGYVIIEA